jgi:hypothetical protein
MSLPEQEIARVEQLIGALCRQRTMANEVKLAYAIRGDRVTLVESRPFFVAPDTWFDLKVAQFEFNPETNVWTLYWYNMKNKRFPYPTGRNRDTLEKLVLEVERDPTGIFWG